MTPTLDSVRAGLRSALDGLKWLIAWIVLVVVLLVGLYLVGAVFLLSLFANGAPIPTDWIGALIPTIPEPVGTVFLVLVVIAAAVVVVGAALSALLGRTSGNGRVDDDRIPAQRLHEPRGTPKEVDHEMPGMLEQQGREQHGIRLVGEIIKRHDRTYTESLAAWLILPSEYWVLLDVYAASPVGATPKSEAADKLGLQQLSMDHSSFKQTRLRQQVAVVCNSDNELVRLEPADEQHPVKGV